MNSASDETWQFPAHNMETRIHAWTFSRQMFSISAWSRRLASRARCRPISGCSGLGENLDPKADMAYKSALGAELLRNCDLIVGGWKML